MRWFRRIRDFLNGDSVLANVIAYAANKLTTGEIGRNLIQVKKSIEREVERERAGLGNGSAWY